jgi:hypothetical protein
VERTSIIIITIIITAVTTAHQRHTWRLCERRNWVWALQATVSCRRWHGKLTTKWKWLFWNGY